MCRRFGATLCEDGLRPGRKLVSIVQRWTGREARALREALRLSVRSFAAYLGVGARTVAAWDSGDIRVTPRKDMQAVLDTALSRADEDTRMRFAAIVAAWGRTDPDGRPGLGTQARSLASSAPPIIVPQRRVPAHKIRGRAASLRYLDDIVANAEHGRYDQRPGVVVLYGIGGAGKTTVAVEAAHRVQQRGVTVWWIPADNADGVRAALYAVAFAAGARDADFDHAHPADVLWQRLDALPRPWLLVLDNADDPSRLSVAGSDLVDGTGWLRPPRHRAGTVLLTSRDGRPEVWASWIRLWHVAVLEPASAARVLIDLAPSAGRLDDARPLAAALGGLPLALELAGRYLASAATDPLPGVRTASFTAYLATLDQRLTEAAMSNDGSGITGGDRRALRTTWEMSLDLLTKQGHDLARPLLRLLACFGGVPLPYQVLKPALLGETPLFPNATPERLNESLRALAALGLVVIDKPAAQRSPLLTMHPVVRATTHANIAASDESAAYVELMTDLLLSATDDLDANNAADWPEWAQLAPHCHATLEHIAKISEVRQGERQRALRPAQRAAWYRYMAGLYQAAADDYRAIYHVAEHALGSAHPDTLSVRNNLARCIRETGDHERAEILLREVLQTARDCLGDHPVTINIRINLARTVRERGHTALAEAEFRSIIELARHTLGDHHPDTLVAWMNLAVTLREQGRHAEAREQYRGVLEAWRCLFPEDDLTTLDIRYELAETIRQGGAPQAAEHEYRAILTIIQPVYGDDHPNTLIVRQGLANALREAGRLDAARNELQDILRLRRSRLGPLHPFTEATQHLLNSLVA